MLLHYAAVLLLILAEARCSLKPFKKLSCCFPFSYYSFFSRSDVQNCCPKQHRDTTCSARFTEGCGTFLSSTVTHHLSGKLTKQFIATKMIFTVDFIDLKFTELSLITPLFPWNCPPLPWARFYSSSTICQEVGRVAYVSSSMSVHGGEKGGWEQAVFKKKKASREQSFYWIPFLCADCWHSRTNSQTDEGGGKKKHISTTKRQGLL